ncbi:MAG TPA: long-chain fatty acid--CoA ligase [Candidatus Binatia bacterium]|nr:long-chain fatty acid--CoA ligase [Candidatus Binatia bacterium]
MNIFSSLERAQKQFPDKQAIVYKHQPTNYRELHDRACRLGAALTRCYAVQPGDRVAIFLPNIPEFVVAYYAIEKLGAIAVSLNVMLKRDEVEFILRDCGASLVVSTPQLLDQVPADVPSLRGIVTVGETDRSNCLSFSELLSERAPADSSGVDLDTNDGAAILYTSGTTGKPKGVLLTHGNLRFNSEAVNRYTQMTADDRLLCFLPLFHCFGQNFIMNGAVNASATLLLHDRFVPDEILESARANQASVFLGVPAVYMRFLAQPQCESYLEKIRYYFTAAAPMPAEVARRWRERFGKTIHEGYGLTETSPFASHNHETLYREESVGTALEGVEIKVLGEKGETLPPGELGEIAIRGPNVMKGYFNRPEETTEVLRDGWFLTGDIGKIDRDGYVYLVDRSKDMINVSGFKVWPREVEEVLSKHDDVVEAAVIGIPDPLSGEAVKAFIVRRKGAQLTEKEAISFCRERIAVYKAPRSVEFIDALPRNPSGKVLKRELRLRES